MLTVEHVGDSTFTTLAVDPDDRFVASPDVLGVNRKVRHAPGNLFIRFTDFLGSTIKALLNRILVAAGESGKDQFTGVWLTLRNFHAGRLFVDLSSGRQVRKIEAGFDTVAVHVQSHDDDVEVTGPLPVSEKRSFDTISTGHQAQLSCRDSSATVIVRVQADNGVFPVIDIAAKPLDLVGMHVRRRPLHRSRKIQNNLLVRVGFPNTGNCVTDLQRIIHLRIGEALRRILQRDLGIRESRDQLFNKLCPVHGNLLDAFPGGITKGDPTLQRRCRVVKVNDRFLHPFKTFEGAANQVFTRLHEDLYSDIIGNPILLHERSKEIELRIGR